MDLYLQGSSDLRMCGSQTDQNTTQILLFWGDHLMFYRVFGVNLMWCVTVFWAAGVCTSISACACIRTYIVYIYSFSKHYLKKICKYTKWFKAVRIFFFFLWPSQVHVQEHAVELLSKSKCDILIVHVGSIIKGDLLCQQAHNSKFLLRNCKRVYILLSVRVTMSAWESNYSSPTAGLSKMFRLSTY